MSEPTPATPLRVLYAEDVADLRLLTRMLLHPVHHTLECYENGRLAWDRVRSAPNEFDLIITDHHMPVMEGLEFVMQLRTIPYRGRIIVVSSDLDPATAVLYRQLNVDRILNKPVMPLIFRQVLAELFPAAVPADWRAAPTGGGRAQA